MKSTFVTIAGLSLSLGFFFAACTEDTTDPKSQYSTEKKKAQIEWSGNLPDTNPLRAPMAEGATAFLYISNFRTLSPYAVSSEDPHTIECFSQVDEFNSPNGSVRCSALKEGTARIQITSSQTGEVLDRFSLNALPVAKIEGPQTITLGQNRILPFEFFPYSKEGFRLVGSGGLNYEARGAIQLSEKNWRTQIGDLFVSLMTLGFYRGNINSELIQVEAETEMTDSLLIVSARSGVSLEVPVRIDTSTPVSRIQLDLSTASIQVGIPVTVSARAYDRENFEVKNPICRWNMEGAAEKYTELERSRNSLTLKFSQAGEIQVTCTIQNVARSIRIVAQ